MDDVTDLIERFADRGHPRGAQRVLDDARRGTVALQRQSPPSTPERRGRLAVAAFAGVAVVVAAFLVGRDSRQPGPVDRGSSTVLDNVSDSDAAQLCEAFATLYEQANESKRTIDPKTTASTAEQYLELAAQARQVGAVAFADALTRSSVQLTLQAQTNLDLINRVSPTTTISLAQFRVGFLTLRQSDTELELACAVRGHDPLIAQLSNSDETPPTTATR